MSVLVLVRHAQASFISDDYDRLSSVGEEQARRLGEYWAARGDLFSEAFVGPRQRHQRTADLVGDGFRRAGLPWPEPVVLEEIDEYDLTGLLDRLAPVLARQDSAFERLVAVHRLSEGLVERARTFQQMFEVLLTHWQTAPVNGAEGLEPWPEFRRRVVRGLERMTAGTRRGRRVVAFTSGGYIGAATASVLGAPDRTALELSWRLRNASLTHLLFSQGRLTIDDFNTMPHLSDPADWTFR